MSTKHNTKHNRKRSNYPKRALYELRKNAGCSDYELREVRDMS